MFDVYDEQICGSLHGIIQVLCSIAFVLWWYSFSSLHSSKFFRTMLPIHSTSFTDDSLSLLGAGYEVNFMMYKGAFWWTLNFTFEVKMLLKAIRGMYAKYGKIHSSAQSHNQPWQVIQGALYLSHYMACMLLTICVFIQPRRWFFLTSHLVSVQHTIQEHPMPTTLETLPKRFGRQKI